MRISQQVSLAAAVLLLSALAANTQVFATNDTAGPGTVPLSNLITTVAKKTGKKFVIDPRVRASVALVGEEQSSVTYDELLIILNTYGFVAVRTGSYVVIAPDADTRMEPLPVVSGNESLPDDEAVTAVIHVKSMPAAWLVPILRPLVPQWGHLAANLCSNDLILVERFANVRRMETIIRAMDKGQPLKLPSCPVPTPGDR
jgi:general secretion pathway protein D